MKSVVDGGNDAPARLFAGGSMSQVFFREYPFGQVGVFSAASPTGDGRNQDAALILPVGPARAVLAVTDGLGGHAGGAEAASLALAALERSVAAVQSDDQPLREAILQAFDRANEEVCALACGAATTLAVVDVHGPTARTYHVGDSAIVSFGARGRLKSQTISHSPVGYALESGFLDETSAMEHEDRHLVSNAIGDRSMHVGVSSRFPLHARDTLVVASDGLFDNMTPEEIIEALRAGPLERALSALVEECQERMRCPLEGRPSKPDDLTIVTFRLPR